MVLHVIKKDMKSLKKEWLLSWIGKTWWFAADLAVAGSRKQLQYYSVKSRLHSWISVSNGLVEMFGKCGSI